MEINNIVMIGSGRVATQLGKQLRAKNKTILQVYSRNIEHAQKLAEITGSMAISDVSEIVPDADLYLISVVDDAIKDIAEKLNIRNKIVAHTSGSVPMKVLEASSSPYGVFYPLQTFVKNKEVTFDDIPVCIEAADKNTENALLQLGKELSNDVRLIDSEQRLYIHIAAVFVSNFTNFMYLMGQDILEKAGVSFDILLPLIRETADKISHTLPHHSQTGPAARGDVKTMEKHLKVLHEHPDKKEIYRQLSYYIANYFNTNNPEDSGY